MGNPPEAPTQVINGAPKKKIWDQDWYKWCEVITKVWGLLTAVYAGASKFLIFLPVGTFDGPHWAGVMVYYFLLPISVLGLYMYGLGLLLLITSPFAGKIAKKFSLIVSIPVFVIALEYILRSETPGYWFMLPFFTGIGVIFLVGAGIFSKISGKRI
jgi:hypothetical protein